MNTSTFPIKQGSPVDQWRILDEMAAMEKGPTS